MSCRVNQQKSDSVICTDCFQISLRGAEAMVTKPTQVPMCRFCGMIGEHARDCMAIFEETPLPAVWPMEAEVLEETRSHKVPLELRETRITRKRDLLPRIVIERFHAHLTSKRTSRLMMAAVIALAFALGSATAQAKIPVKELSKVVIESVCPAR